MGEYSRPDIPAVVLRDEDGTIVEYGRRWAEFGGAPPEDSYSVIEHPERFAPLRTVAAALIDHLVSTYDVEVEEGPQVIADIPHPPALDDTVRAVRLVPKSGSGAPLVVVLTSFPVVHVHAGVLFTTRYPSCGCNACDETWEPVAEELEWQLLAIAGGGFAEEVSPPRRASWSYERGVGLVMGMGQTVSHRLHALDGGSGASGQSRAEDIPPALLARAQATLDAVAAVSADGSWPAWPPRIADQG